MRSYKVWLDYDVRCSAKGYMYVDANSPDEAMRLAEKLGNEIENTHLEEQEILGGVISADVEELNKVNIQLKIVKL